MLRLYLHKKKPGLFAFFNKWQLKRMRKRPFLAAGKIYINDTPFYYHDARCFMDTWDELFVRRIYQFHTQESSPYILDCGANMGLSVLFFSLYYPNATIIAFEPDESIYPYLEKNIASFKLNNVVLHKKAVWNSDTQLKFYTDFGMGGRIDNKYSNQEAKTIEATDIKKFLQQKVHFLKMDIEGAEYEVITHIKNELHNIEHLFVEYHSTYNKPQQLHTILDYMQKAGFRYHLSQSFSRKRPFIDTGMACENMDMAINIFGYRK